MKLRISHLHGIYDDHTGADLCELFCVPEHESYKELFESGWLPTTNGEWYQSRSSRVKILPISSRRKYELKKIEVSKIGDYKKIFEESKSLYPIRVIDDINVAISYPHEIYYFNNSVVSIVSVFDNIPFISATFGGRLRKDGITPMTVYYHLNRLIGNTYDYLYIAEWYSQFNYKSNFPNFEWWNGEKWIKK